MSDESESDWSNHTGNSSLEERNNSSSSVLYRKERLLIPSRDRSYNYYIDDSTSESDCFVSDCELNSDENESLNLIRYNNYIYNVFKRNNYRSWNPISGGYVNPNILNLRHTTFSKKRDFDVTSGVSGIVNYTEEFLSVITGARSVSVSECHRRKSTCKSKANNQNISVNKRRNRSKSIVDSNQLHNRLSSTDKNMSQEKNASSSSKRKRGSTDNLQNDTSVRTKRTKFDNETDIAVKRKQTLITDLVSKTNKSKNNYVSDSSSDVFVKQHSSRRREENNSINATSKSNPKQKSVEKYHSSSSISEDEGIGTAFREDSSPTNYSRLGTQEINFDTDFVSRRSRKDSISESSGSDYNETIVDVTKSKKKDLIDSNLCLSEMPGSFPRKRSIKNKNREKVQSSSNTRQSTTSNDEDDNGSHDASFSTGKDGSTFLPHSEKSPAKNNDEILENSSSKRSTKKHAELNKSKRYSQNLNLSRRKSPSASSNNNSDDENNEEGSQDFNEVIVRRSSVDSSTNENAPEDRCLNAHKSSESESTDIERGKLPLKRDKQKRSVVFSANENYTNARLSRKPSSFLKDSEENSNGCRNAMSTGRRTSLSSSDGNEDRRKKNTRNSSISHSENVEVMPNIHKTPSDRNRRSSTSSDSSENNRRKERSGNSSVLRSEVAGMKTPNVTGRKSFSDSSENETRENVPMDSRRQSFSTNNCPEDGWQKDKARPSDVRNKRHSSGPLDDPDDERTKDRRQSSSSRTTRSSLDNAGIDSTVIKEKAKKSSMRDETLLQTPGFMNSLKSKATSTPFNKNANERRIEFQEDEGAICSSDEETFVNNQVGRYRHHIIPEALKNIDEKLVQGIRSEQFEEDLLFVEDISDNDEIWVAQCPKSLKVESLLGKKFDLNGMTTLKGSSKDGDHSVHYEAFTSALSNNDGDESERNASTVNNVYCLIPSRRQQKLKLQAIKTKGTIKIEERIALPTPNTIKYTSSTEICLPECLKIRHPLLGSDFSEQLKALEYLNRSCNSAFEESFDKSHKRKKKRKKDRSLSENRGYEGEKLLNYADGDGDGDGDDDDVDLSHEKKKKKKRKHKSSLNEDIDGDGFHVNKDKFPMEVETEEREYETVNKKKKKKKHKYSHYDD